MRKRNRGVEIKRTEELFDVLKSKVISSNGYVRKTSRAHIIDIVGAGLLPAVADSSNIFFMISLEEVHGAENIYVPIGASKGRTASIVRLGPDLFFFSTLGERGDSLLPGRVCRVGLRGPYGGRKAARWGKNVLQDGDEWLRRAHDERQMCAKEGFGARVACDDPTFYTAPQLYIQSVQLWSSYQQYTHHIGTFHTVTHHPLASFPSSTDTSR